MVARPLLVCLLVTTCGCDRTKACVEASRNNAADAVQLCQAVYEDTHSPRSGGALAMALATHQGKLADIGALATAIGDKPDGAEAWHALGDAFTDANEFAHGLVAYARALGHRDPTDLRSQTRDAIGLHHNYTRLDRFEYALRYAGLAFDLTTRNDEADLTAYTLAGIATLLYDVGDFPGVEQLVSDVDKLVDAESKIKPNLWKLRGLVQRARGRHLSAKTEFERALIASHAAHLDPVAHVTSFEYASMELDAGNVDAAATILATDLAFGKADDEEKLRQKLIAARIQFARHNDAGVVDLVPRELPGDSKPELSEPIADLQAVRGQALIRLARFEEAEVALRDATSRHDKTRAALAFDVVKPWLVAKTRRPLEDLFRLVIRRGNTAEAFAIAQRAMARSILDGVVSESGETTRSVAADIDDAGKRAAGIIRLTKSLRISPAAQPPSADELLGQLRGRHVLTYFHAGDDLFLIDLTAAGSLSIVPVGNADELKRLADAWTASVTTTQADELGARLLPPQVELRADEILYVVVDAPIREIPFSALRRGDAFVVQHNPVIYEPSAAVLIALSARNISNGPTVVLGDPRNDLAGARLEALELAPDHALIGPAATKKALFEAKEPRLLHIAAHTVATSAGRALDLADDPLAPGEILDHGTSANLVVLASCASADPHDRAELGPLATAFLTAGARTVVASQRAVDDKIALAFSRDFYPTGMEEPALAVARAQRTMIERDASISTWSNFVVFGMPTSGGGGSR